MKYDFVETCKEYTGEKCYICGIKQYVKQHAKIKFGNNEWQIWDIYNTIMWPTNIDGKDVCICDECSKKQQTKVCTDNKSSHDYYEYVNQIPLTYRNVLNDKGYYGV